MTILGVTQNGSIPENSRKIFQKCWINSRKFMENIPEMCNKFSKILENIPKMLDKFPKIHEKYSQNVG